MTIPKEKLFQYIGKLCAFVLPDGTVDQEYIDGFHVTPKDVLISTDHKNGAQIRGNPPPVSHEFWFETMREADRASSKMKSYILLEERATLLLQIEEIDRKIENLK